MRKQKRLQTGTDYIIFVDTENKEQAYGIHKDYFEMHRDDIYEKYAKPELIEEADMVKAFIIQKVGEHNQYVDLYDVVGNEIDFPLSRVDFIFVQIVPE